MWRCSCLGCAMLCGSSEAWEFFGFFQVLCFVSDCPQKKFFFFFFGQ
jgi:hypothetical protein